MYTIMYAKNTGERRKHYMTTTLMEKIGNTQNDQLEDVEEYIRFLKTLSNDEKKELRGIIRGMQTMKDIQCSNAV